jgi:hypothetical protein
VLVPNDEHRHAVVVQQRLDVLLESQAEDEVPWERKLRRVHHPGRTKATA